jgi:hypothetical protein
MLQTRAFAPYVVGEYRYKKAGVTFLDLAPSGRVQSSLFDQPDDARSVGRMRAIDQLNARFGRGTIGFGTAGECQAWSLRRGIRFAALHNGLERIAARLKRNPTASKDPSNLACCLRRLIAALRSRAWFKRPPYWTSAIQTRGHQSIFGIESA